MEFLLAHGSFRTIKNKKVGPARGVDMMMVVTYSWMQYMQARESATDRARKNGSAEFLILAQLEDRPKHGYEIACEIERRSRGTITFLPASLYPVLYRLEGRGLIKGRWLEAAGERRRRRYALTSAGRRELTEQRADWTEFLQGIRLTAGLQGA
jgi:DNA-binding PadR family transcriptional regulator